MIDSSFYKISDFHLMDPFLMTITSGEDHWMYISSTGCLTAGRNKAEFALFPYVTDDILHKNSSFTGPITIIRIKKGNQDLVWEPFSNNNDMFNLNRNLYKNSIGNTIIFEEIKYFNSIIFIYYKVMGMLKIAIFISYRCSCSPKFNYFRRNCSFMCF